MTNPLLAAWNTPFGLPPFAAITDDDFGPAFDAALDLARVNIAAITGDPTDATFDNTIAAMELAEDALSRVAGVFFNVAGADSNDARDVLERDLAPKLSAFSSEVTNNRALFARVEALWNARDGLGLTDEQMRVLTLYHRMIERAGAALTGAASARLTAVKSRLAVLEIGRAHV